MNLSNASNEDINENVSFFIQVTSEQEDYARPFVDALKNLHNNKKGQPQPPQNTIPAEFSTTGTTGAIVANSVITTTSAPTSTILSTVGMSGGSVTYTNLGKRS